MKSFLKEELFWIRKPKKILIDDEKIEIYTEPNTDLWQRTYYAFQNDNAPVLQTKTSDKYFSFVVNIKFETNHLFEQAGVAIYIDSENWFKASVEYENEDYQRLGSVVTNNGYSDWATTDIDVSIKNIWFRLNRREKDFYIEYSLDNKDYHQMRMFHLFKADKEIPFGIYACSPGDSSFRAVFSDMHITECKWLEHK